MNSLELIKVSTIELVYFNFTSIVRLDQLEMILTRLLGRIVYIIDRAIQYK